MHYLIALFISLASIVIVRILVLSFEFWKNITAQWEAALKFPGGDQKGHWFLGTLPEFRKMGIPGIIKLFREKAIHEKTRVYVTYKTRLQPTFNIMHPEPARCILSTAEPKSKRFGESYSFVEYWLGDGLLISDGKKWERNRRLLTPAFHFRILKQYFTIYNEASKEFMNNIRNVHQTDEYVDTPTLSTIFTLDVILRCAFSYKDNIQQQGFSHPYTSAIVRLADLSTKRTMMPFPPLWMYWWTKNGREFSKYSRYVHEFSQGVIDKRRSELKANPSLASTRMLDFLDILLTARDKNGIGLSNEDIRAEVDTFLFEGHDTTASLVTFTLYCLAKYPAFQAKVRTEINAVIENPDFITFDDLPKLTYTTMFIKEVMRMYTPVPGISRDLSQPLEVDGVLLPKNSRINIIINHIHYNGDVWDSPYEFRPERFSDENFFQHHPYMYVPFSAGPRNCIGQNLAVHEEKVVLCHIVKNFEISLKPGHEIEMYPTLVNRSSTGVPLKFTPISY